MACSRFWRVGIATMLALAATMLGGRAHAQQLAGVYVDADGVLHKRIYQDPNGRLMQERIRSARASLPGDVGKRSALRKVSLNRLEREIAKARKAGRQITPEMLYLAGMTRLTHVFFYPESGDIVIAGPAEGWVRDLAGRVRGIESGRPVLELQDMVVALRMFPPGGPNDTVIGCSIDPTEEGLARMQAFLRQVGGRATPADTQYIVDGLRTSLGLQKVRILGVPPNTHFAQVMVEADYRMKLIGIGLERPPIKLASYVDRANPAAVSRNALQRWYFTPDYQCVRVSDDDLAMALEGEGVKLIGSDELVRQDGTRVRARRADRASQAFTHTFTARYPQLAAKSPVFAQLRNLIDMTIAAAFIQKQDYYGKADWTMPVFGDERQFPVETYTAPQEVDTVVTSRWKGNQLMTPVGGGVNIQAWRALDLENRQIDEEGELAKMREGLKVDLAEGQWWWD